MRVLLSADGLRGDVETRVGLAVQVRALQACGAAMSGCVPPDFAELLACAALPLVAVVTEA